MNIDLLLSDTAILAELGTRLTQARVAQLLTQEELARKSGVSKRTVERLEAGASVQLSSLLAILRHLRLTQNLEQLIPEQGPSPFEILAGYTEQRKKKRVRKPSVAGAQAQRSGSEEVAERGSSWVWGDER